MLGERFHVGTTVYKEVGCAACLETGYRGRSGIYELLLVDDPIRSMILKNADSGAIKKKSVEAGMRTLLNDGARKVLQGFTTTEEVLRIAKDEEMVLEV